MRTGAAFLYVVSEVCFVGYFWKWRCLAPLSLAEMGDMKLSVGDMVDLLSDTQLTKDIPEARRLVLCA